MPGTPWRRERTQLHIGPTALLRGCGPTRIHDRSGARTAVSQSAISSAIAALEKEVDVQLLLRHHAKGLTLTAAGEEFYRELRSFLTHGDELAEIARSAAEGLVGQLTVGCFDTLAPFRLPGLLSEFSKRHPRVEVSVIEAELAALKSALRSGACEVALTYGLDLEDEFDHVVIGRAAPYAIVSSEDPLAVDAPSPWPSWPQPMILLDLPHSGPYFLDLVGRSGSEPAYDIAAVVSRPCAAWSGPGWVRPAEPASEHSGAYAGDTVHELESRTTSNLWRWCWPGWRGPDYRARPPIRWAGPDTGQEATALTNCSIATSASTGSMQRFD